MLEAEGTGGEVEYRGIEREQNRRKNMNRINLMILTASLAIPAAAAGKEDTPQPDQKFIIGGQNTSTQVHPPVAALMDRTSLESFFDRDDKFLAQFCAGTLIAPNWILTSAHCVVRFDPSLSEPTNIPVNPREIIVALNLTDLDANEGDLSDVERIVVHEDFDGRLDSPTVSGDIALIKTATDFLEQLTAPLRIAPGAGTPATIVGWGADGYNNNTDEATSFPAVLQAAATTIISNEDCAAANAGAFDINNTHICAQEPGVDTCVADSGGPLLVAQSGVAGGASNFVQVGITSFGIGCADPDFPGVYTRVSEYFDWIEKNLEETILFATFGNGRSGALVLISEIVLYNPHVSRLSRGTLVFKDPDGNVLEADSILASGDGSFAIGPLGSSTFSTSGTGNILSGSVWVTSDEEVSGVIRFSLSGTGIAGVSPSQPGTRLIAPVRREGTVNTGIAILNADNVKVRVILELKDENGDVVGVAVRDLEPMARIAEFVDELFRGADTDGFRGTVCMDADGKVGVIAIEQGTGDGEFTTLQVTVVQ